MRRVFPCPKCGSQSVVGQRFCEACGEKFPYSCPMCGASIEPAYKACPNCRTKLGWGEHQRKPLPDVARIHQERQRTYGHRGERQQPQKTNAWLGFMAIVLCIGAIFYAIAAGLQGGASEGLSGGFIFEKIVPAPALTPPPSTEDEQEPAPIADLPSYTADEVVALAKSFSPDCRKTKPG